MHAKATFILADAECQRRYGSLWKSKTLAGVVEGVRTEQGSKRKSTLIEAAWAVGSVKRRRELLLRNVKPGSCPLPTGPNGGVDLIGREPQPSFPVEHASTDTQESSVASHERGSNLLELEVTGQAPVNCDSRDLAPPGAGASTPVPLDHCNCGTNYSRRNGMQSAFVGLQTSGTPSDSGCSTSDVEAHGVRWKVAPVPNCHNGIPRTHHWEFLGWAGQKLSAGSISAANEDDSIIQDFYSTFPLLHLSRIVSMTNKVLLGKGRRSTTWGEVLRFFGLLVLMKRFEFGSGRDFWSKTSRTKYCMLPNFTEIIGRTRFDALFSCLAYSMQPDEDACLSSVEHRWALINDFVEAFNDHRRRHVTPSERLCVDESMIRWYGIGGTWIDMGLPHYVSIDRKPEDGCKVQNIACGTTGIILKLEVVSTADDERRRAYEGTANHGTTVLRRLVEPWQGTNRTVCADSYFASVQSAVTLLKLGLHFTGVVKTVTRGFPLKFLSERELTGRGQHISMVSDVDGGYGELLALVWVDRNRRYLISTTGSTARGVPYIRYRWRQTV